MKKQDFELFIENAFDKRVEGINKQIDDEFNKAFEEWKKKPTALANQYREFLRDFLKNTQDLNTEMSEYIGFSIANVSQYHIQNGSEIIHDVKWTKDEYYEATLNEALQYIFKRSGYKSSDNVIALRKERTEIRNEFDNIKANVNAIRGAKQKMNWLVELGFNEADILKFDSTDYSPALASVDTAKVFG